MDIETAWGVKWHVASLTEILIVLIIILLIIVIFLLIRMYLTVNSKMSHEFQYVLFKAKNRGLTNFQYKIVRGMAEMLKLKRPSDIIDNPHLYEESIGTFINYIISKKGENPESYNKIFMDIVITYEKLYKNQRHKRPLTNFKELGTGDLLFFYTNEEEIFLGKIIDQNERYIELQLFRKPSEISKTLFSKDVNVFFWRPGDAEYTFTSSILNQEKNRIFLAVPESISRGKEVRLPFINVIFTCSVSSEKTDIEDGTDNTYDKFEATLFKMCENELVIRTNKVLDYSATYILDFVVQEFAVHANANVIADKTISDKGVFYYTFKLIDTSEAANKVIRSYIYEHL